MSALLDKIKNYFERDNELHVLFIFQEKFIADELDTVEWPEDYRWVKFKGDWFTTKYRLDHDWADEKVVIYFDQPSPLKDKSQQEDFPLMDVLVANMEFHTQDAAAFIQQYGIPDSMTGFVSKNIQQLQSSKMMRLLEPFYRDGSITEDVGVRAFISSYLGLQRVLDWDNILLEVIALGRNAIKQKRYDFFNKLRKNKSTEEKLQQKFINIFGVGFDDNTEEKVGKIVEVLKYNAITQNLAPSEADDYTAIRVKDSYALQQINRLIELSRSQDTMAKAFDEVMTELGGGIKDENIIKWYGTDAKYNFVPDALCIPIVKTLMTERIDVEPTAAIHRLEDLYVRHNADDLLAQTIIYGTDAAHYYEKALSIDSITLNTPDDYVATYQQSWYQVDQLYRLSTESYYKLDPNTPLFEVMQDTKKKIDQHYAKLVNRMNLEWTKCIEESGGIRNLHLLRQQDFYETKVATVQKKIVVIISDAMRYEVAQELIGKLAQRKHIAHLDAALAMLPTETKFCKPALFPHDELELYSSDDGQAMGVDQRSLDTTESRKAQLINKGNESSTCVSFDLVSKYDQDTNREIFKNKVVYVMHETIDKKSHDKPAKDVVDSCRQAINELDTLIHKIHETYNVTEVIVTSDHGFLFNDIEFKEKDKQKVDEDALEKKSRYYMTHSDTPVKGIEKYKLEDVSGIANSNGIYVAVPKGTNRLAAPSGGYMFAHGGASMEEMIIPVLVSEQERNDGKKKKVDVVLLDQKLHVTASRLRFKLVQAQAVSMEYTGREIACALYDGDEPVTPIKTYMLDKTDTSLDKRTVQVDLTLNKNVNSKVLTLRVFDTKDQLNSLIKENVTNNTLIGNDFDF